MTRIASKGGIYFGTATIYGLLGWTVSEGSYQQWVDWTFVPLGVVLFFYLDDLIARLNPTWFTRANIIGYAITALFAVGFGLKFWLDVG